MTQNQSGMIDFLQALLGERNAARIDTHISTVLMADNSVFKLKRAVKLPYADFSTPALRLAACEDEFRLNARITAPLYVGVRRLTRSAEGALIMDGDGELVDAVVEMRRFHQRDLFSRMADESRLTPDLIKLAAARIARFHQSIPPETDCDGATSMAYAMDINRKQLFAARLFPAARVRTVLAKFDAAFSQNASVLSERSRAGFLRHCHGDLHLANICLFEGAPTPFDCLEFSPRLAKTDVLYDLAFLLMDLWHRALPHLANAAFNRYLDETGDINHLGLMGFLMAVRAAVRAHVLAAQAGQSAMPDPLKEDAALRYFALADELLGESPKRLVAIGGLSGSGKSSTAAKLASGIGAPPGARIVSTDRLRKAHFGVAAMTRLPEEAYRPEVSRLVYEKQREIAGCVLRGGHSAIADGVFLKQEERAAIAKTASDHGATFRAIWLTAPQDTLVRRVEQRVGDPSDATADVVALQERHTPSKIDWPSVKTNRSQPDIIRAAKEILES